jgi:aryl-phospho-beta-D-glucosidase BglC (GH1 family)
MASAMKPIRLLAAAGLVTLGLTLHAGEARLPAGADPARWFGFNLLEKFTLRGQAPYREEDFKWIAELGFNFVRLPMDYRCYTEAGDWLQFKEATLREIDQAIAFGERHGVHVCLNLHRAPGYCINPPAEATDLWKDQSAQDAFVAHWVMFARRYKDIPPERLSFNLLNEPTRNTRESYLAVNRRTIEAIQAADPRRPIIVDGNSVGREPFPEFLPYANVIQATRGYHPGTISHYRANWVKGSDRWPVPTWPAPQLVGRLFGPAKPELKAPLILRGDFPAGTEFSVTIHQLSSKATLQARADGVPLFERLLEPRSQPGAWEKVPGDSEWTYHRPVPELKLVARLSAPAREFALENIAGDWVICSALEIRRPDGPSHQWSTDQDWGRPQAPHEVTADGRLLPAAGTPPDQSLVGYLQPWVKIAAAGEQVFVGEWGCFNRTPHPVALAWMKSWLERWREARFGWALWNFRGSFGVLDSGRSDVAYEDWRGHKLDRAMLQLLQDYAKPGP